jgi:NADH-quinone oxidoreductase subunit J
MTVSTAVFYLVAAITLGSAMIVAFSRNIIYSAFSLLGTFAGVAGIYIFLGADFVAAVQVLIYVGGILVLVLFAVMLTHRITDVEITNRAAGRIPALIVVGVFVYLLAQTCGRRPGPRRKRLYLLLPRLRLAIFLDTVAAFGLPAGPAALIGAVVISRKEIKE